MKVTCGCLNVKIHAKKTDKIINFAQLGIGHAVNEPFFTLEIADAQLDLGGITIAQSVLVRERNVCDWVVHECLNCETLTHATHGSKVLVNLHLKTEQTNLESSADYSPLYKIVLHSRGNDNQNRPGTLSLHSGKYDHLQKTLTTIQQQLANFIESEKRAMEERIRAYEEQQKANFANLKNKVSRDKNTLINIVLAVQESSLQDEESDILLDGDGLDSPVSDDRPDEPSPDFSDGPQRQKFFNPITPIVSNPEHSQPKNISKKSNDDDMFDLEGLDDEFESRPFYISDDDNEDTDDSSINDDVPYSSRITGHGGHSRMTSHMYSQSVPISMPQWRPFSTHSSLEEDDERAPAPDPEDMAASIKALARSVHGDGTEIFGDLPRRRLNTMELGKI